MTPAILSILAAAVALCVIFFVVKLFIKGAVLTMIAAVLGVILLVHALRAFGVVTF